MIPIFKQLGYSIILFVNYYNKGVTNETIKKRDQESFTSAC